MVDEERGALIMTSFGIKLKSLREYMGISQEELGKMINSSKQVISRYETGLNSPRIDTVNLLSQALNIDLTILVNSDYSAQDLINNYHSNPASIMTEDEAPTYTDPIDPATRQVPLIGTIAAGAPIYADEYIEDYFTLPASMRNIDFALRVQGESMINIGINTGDIVFCKQQNHAENGDVAVCLIDNENATLKRYRHIDNITLLIPENDSMSELVFKGEEQNRVLIQGIAKKLLRRI